MSNKILEHVLEDPENDIDLQVGFRGIGFRVGHTGTLQQNTSLPEHGAALGLLGVGVSS